MRTPLLIVALLLAASVARADEPKRYNLDELTDLARASTRARMAKDDTDAARAKVDEADAARLPSLSATAFLAPSPEIRCDNADCTRTSPTDFAIRVAGAFGGASLTITQPLYTFGKIASARDAARDGVSAQAALEDETAGDITVDAAKAYWGLKVARYLRYMLEDGVADITDAGKTLDQNGATQQDKLRLQVLLAEANAQLTEARAAESDALAAVRALIDDPTGTADIDDDELAAVELDLPAEDATVKQAQRDRPQVRAADAGARAADRLADYESDQYWPDFGLVVTAGWSDAQGVDDAPAAVYSEPFHTASAGIAVALKWNASPWTTHAKVEHARAAAARAHDQATLARTGATLDARTAWADATEAKDRVAAASSGEEASRGWVASVLQANAIGTAETHDLTDAYIAWFQMRARLANAIFQWNVATVRLGRATGEFHAAAARQTP